MNCNELKRKGVEHFINRFNTDNKNECDIVINNVTFFSAKNVEISNACILISSCVYGYKPITGCIAIDDINTMYYMDNDLNIVSLNNIEF